MRTKIMMNDFTALNDESWASGQDMEVAREFDVLVYSTERVEAYSAEEARQIIIKNVRAGETVAYIVDGAEEVRE